jgi:predicted CXXCH cytochrome family protein
MSLIRRPALSGRHVAVTLGAVGLALAFAAPAAADGGPHVATVNSGSSSLTADSCAGCHRAHAALGPNLIAAATETALCLTCHGSTGAGATTNVVDGVEAGTSHGLRGGGFVNALMDTAWDGAAVSRPATSAHLYDGTTATTMWGSGAIGSGPGESGMTLACASCHNPHGNNSYRILRPIPTGAPASTGIAVTEQATKVYTVASTQNRYFGEQYGNVVYDWEWQYELVQWCAQCHTRYDALNTSWTGTGGPGSTDSGDPIFKYRHMTRYEAWINCDLCHPGSDGINADDPFGVGYETAHEATCQNCHVAHGSAAQMGTYSGTVAWPDQATAPSGNARSSLLRLDNRGICIGCHNPTN